MSGLSLTLALTLRLLPGTPTSKMTDLPVNDLSWFLALALSDEVLAVNKSDVVEPTWLPSRCVVAPLTGVKVFVVP